MYPEYKKVLANLQIFQFIMKICFLWLFGLFLCCQKNAFILFCRCLSSLFHAWPAMSHDASESAATTRNAIQSKQMHIVNVCQFHIHTVYIQIQAAFQSIFGRRASICERIMKFYLEKQWKIRWISNVTHSRKYSPGWASCKVEWCTEHFNRSPCITQPFIRLLQN